MMTKDRANAACISLTPIFVTLSGLFLVLHDFLFALLCLGGIVACMETRVRMGYRGPRKAMFAAHLALCSAYIVALILLIVGLRAPWLLPLAWLSFFGMTASGAVLLRQSWKRAS